MKEGCPITMLLEQVKALIEEQGATMRLLERILDHCDKCLEKDKKE